VSLRKFASIKDMAETLSYIIIIIGAFFALYQYFEMKYSDRVKETLSYEKRLNDGEFLDAKVSINQAWQPYQSFFEKLHQKTIKSQNDKDKILDKVAQKVIKNKNLSKDIDLLVDFYESLSICVKSDICDQTTALSFFSPYAEKFYQLHNLYIKNKSKSIIGYAKGLKMLLKEEK